MSGIGSSLPALACSSARSIPLRDCPGRNSRHCILAARACSSARCILPPPIRRLQRQSNCKKPRWRPTAQLDVGSLCPLLTGWRSGCASFDIGAGLRVYRGRPSAQPTRQTLTIAKAGCLDFAKIRRRQTGEGAPAHAARPQSARAACRRQCSQPECATAAPSITPLSSAFAVTRAPVPWGPGWTVRSGLRAGTRGTRVRRRTGCESGQQENADKLIHGPDPRPFRSEAGWCALQST